MMSGDGLTVIRRAGARVRVVLFHHAGGSGHSFADWPRRLGDEVEVVLVDYDGLSAPSAPQSVAALASRCAQRLMTVLPLPTLLFGHSLGAAVAYETAHHLQSRTALALAVSSCRSPGELQRGPLPTRSDLSDHALRHYVATMGVGAHVTAPDTWPLVAATLRRHLRLIEGYRTPAPPLCATPVLVLGGNDDPDVPAASLFGWSAHTLGETTYRMFDGNHFYLYENRDLIISAIRERLGPRIGWES